VQNLLAHFPLLHVRKITFKKEKSMNCIVYNGAEINLDQERDRWPANPDCGTWSCDHVLCRVADNHFILSDGEFIREMSPEAACEWLLEQGYTIEEEKFPQELRHIAEKIAE
jgi:hypothetical protein